MLKLQAKLEINSTICFHVRDTICALVFIQKNESNLITLNNSRSVLVTFLKLLKLILDVSLTFIKP